MPEDVNRNVWNPAVTVDTYAGAGEKYQHAVIEQYKTYVEMADRLSSRRAVTNTFFLTLNAALMTALGTVWQQQQPGPHWWLALPLGVLAVQCLAWFWLVHVYRRLSAVKYQVIGALEERLPASPYWKAEWLAGGRGTGRQRYLSLTHLEQWVPLTFAVIYLSGLLALVLVR